MKRLPLEGVKVADFTWATVGPRTTKYLADYGATVVKIESHHRPDDARLMVPFKDGIPGLDRGGIFIPSNNNKLGVSINLNHPRGVEVAKRVIAWADIVSESFRGGRMKKWGLGYEDIKKIKPDIIMLSMCQSGQTGPFHSHPGAGMILTAVSGFTNITGWPDRLPTGPYGPYTDHICPPFNVLAVVAALDYRRRTGKGQYLDMSEHEVCIQVVAPLMLDYTTNNHEVERMGNRSDRAAPYGIYRCQGDDRWCAIAVFTESQWQDFLQVIGNPSWAEDPRFSTLPGRIENAGELDILVEQWTAVRPAEEVMARLQAAGISAGVVATGEDLDHDPQLEYSQYYQRLDFPGVGKLAYKKTPVSFSKLSPEIRRHPSVGEHNEYVFHELLGFSKEEIDELEREKVIL